MRKRIITTATAMAMALSNGIGIIGETGIAQSISASASTSFDSIQTLTPLSTYSVPITSDMPSSFYVDFTLSKTTNGSLELYVEDNSSASIKAEIINSSGNSTGYSATVTSNSKNLNFNLSSGHYYIKFTPGTTTKGTLKFTLKSVKSIADTIGKCAYSSNPKTPEYSVYYGATKLVKGTDYKVSSETTTAENTSATATLYTTTVKIEGIGDYGGTKTYNFTNTVDTAKQQTSITKCNFDYTESKDNSSLIYVVKNGNTTLKEGTDYTVNSTYKDTTEDSIKYRTFTTVFKGMGSYSGSHTETVKIKIGTANGKSDFANCTVTAEKANNEITLVVKDGSKLLTKNTDYTVETVSKTSSTSKNTGTITTIAKYRLAGVGNYVGTQTLTVTNSYTDLTAIDDDDYKMQDRQYTGSAIKPKVKITGPTGVLAEGKDYTLTYSNNVEIGQATITVHGIGLCQGTKVLHFNIVPATVTEIQSSIKTQFAYTGNAIKPIPSTIKLTTGKTLKSGTDYTVTYKNNVNVGLATATIKFKGNYTGTVTKTFKIYPSKQYIQKLTAKKGGFYIDYLHKSSNSASGYQVQYSTDKTFTTYSKKTIAKKSVDTATITGLKSGKTYYVRVKSYKNVTVNGVRKTYWGYSSEIKTVKTK